MSMAVAMRLPEDTSPRAGAVAPPGRAARGGGRAAQTAATTGPAPRAAIASTRPMPLSMAALTAPPAPVAADPLRAGAHRLPAPRATCQRHLRLGRWRARSADACCCASRTTIGSAAGPSSKPRCSTTSTGSASRPTSSRPPPFAPADARDGSRTATPSIARRSRTLTRAGSSTAAPAPGARSRPRHGRRAVPASCAIRARAAIAACRSTTRLGWRVVVEPGDGAASTTPSHGRQPQTPAAQCGDLLVRDRLGNWTYQFAVDLDDHAQGDRPRRPRRRPVRLDRAARSCWRACSGGTPPPCSCTIRW